MQLPIPAKKSALENALNLIWAYLFIVLAMLGPNRVSTIHHSTLADLPLLPLKLKEIEVFGYLGNFIYSLAGVLLFTLACISTGALLIGAAEKWGGRSAAEKPLPFLALVGTSLLAGHWVFSIIFLALAQVGRLQPALVALTLIIGFAAGAYPANAYFIQPLRRREISFFEARQSVKDRLIQWLSISILFLGLMYSSSRLSYDAVNFYFSDPKLTALTGHLQLFRFKPLALNAFQTDIQFAAMMQIFGDQAARMYSWVGGCVFIIFSLAIAEKSGLTKQARGIWLALMLTSTAFVDLLGDGKIDLVTSALAIAAVYWMLADENKKNLFIVGALGGLAMAARPYNIFLLGVFIPVFYLFRMFGEPTTQKRSIGNLIKIFFWIALGAILPMLVNLADNWAVFGNPLAMFINAQGMTTEKWQWSFDPKYIWLIRALYPVVVTFLSTPQSLGTVSPVFLVFLPMLLSGRNRKKINLTPQLRQILPAAAIALTLWILLFYTVLEIRYVFFLWAILFMPLAEFIAKMLEHRDAIFRNLLAVLLIVFLFFSAARVFYVALDTYSPIDKAGNPHCGNFDFCDYLKSINASAPQGSRTLTLNAFRYYLRTDLFACSTKGGEYTALYNSSLKGAGAFWEEVHRQGYAYIAYEKNYVERHLQLGILPGPANTPSWMKLEPIYGIPGEDMIAYKINIVSTPPVIPEKTCVNHNGIWLVETLSGPVKP